MEFAEYVARQRPALMRFATVLTCRTWLAEDLVSDVLGRAFERWDRISGMAEPNAYVRRMVVNACTSFFRRAVRKERATDSGLVLDGSVADRSDQHAERERMLALLRRLPAKQRAVLVLRHYEGVNFEQMARLLAVPASTLKSRFAVALRRMRERLTELGFGNEGEPA
jgi:RNA polymerase sigma factor (sigma-70 family)